MSKKPTAKCGVVGLANLGNTCYLNSALQCLSNIYELTRYFLEGLFAVDINSSNKLGYGGDMVRAYAQLMNTLWNDDLTIVAPHHVKIVLAKHNLLVNPPATLNSIQAICNTMHKRCSAIFWMGSTKT